MNNNLNLIASNFQLEGTVESIVPLGEGFINDTFIIKTVGKSPNYILQKKNHAVFPDVPSMMDNIYRVTSHLKKKIIDYGGDPLRETLTVIPTNDNKLYFKDSEGNFWAACLFIEDTVTYDKADNERLAYCGGVGIGKFQSLLSDFTEPLAETIKGFHNIRWRFIQWEKSLAENKAKRIYKLKEEIDWIESRREEMLAFWKLFEDGILPTRVTHNDTKISNILFDKQSGDVLCVIDLDTVMSSTSLNDFGDAIRSYSNTAAEDEKDLDKVSMSFDIYKAYAEGYLSQRKDSLTDVELQYLPFSARYITYEQVLRFLMDYIDGDTYYKIRYPEHNLVRTKAQYKLLQSMEQQYDKMIQLTSK